MSGFLLVFCTCASSEEARNVAGTLIERRLAACVNILPQIESVYRWEGEVQSANENLLLAKTTEREWPELQRTILAMHSYDNPEIVAVPLSHGAEKYLTWIRESVGIR